MNDEVSRLSFDSFSFIHSRYAYHLFLFLVFCFLFSGGFACAYLSTSYCIFSFYLLRTDLTFLQYMQPTDALLTKPNRLVIVILGCFLRL